MYDHLKIFKIQSYIFFLCSVFILFSCNDETNVVKNDINKNGKPDGFKKAIYNSISYTVTVTSVIESGGIIPKTKSQLPYRTYPANYNPSEPMITSYDMFISETNGEQTLTVKNGNIVNNSPAEFFPQNDEFTVTGNSVSASNIRDYSHTIIPENLSKLNNNYEQSVGGSAKSLAMKSFFNDLVSDKKDILSKANQVFNRVQNVQDSVYKFTKNNTEGYVEITYDAKQMLTTGTKVYKNGVCCLESNYEYRTVNKQTFKTKTTTIRTVKYSDGSESRFRTVRELSNIVAN